VIAKRVDNKKKTSSYKRCADYITDQLNDGAKAATVRINHCLTDTYDLAVKEVTATQAINTRTRNDKTYHLVISFPEGEIPTPIQLADIEDTFCERLGLGEHQRISAVHTNTENLHIHVAINKIHPRTFNCIEPYYDHYKLNELCAELELKHGLQKDNRIKKQQEAGLSTKAAVIQHHSGVMTFEQWIKSEALPAIKAELIKPNANWAALHKVMADYDVTLRPRGAGFVISHRQEKAFIKSSSVWRPLSKSQLEKKLGDFIAPSTACQAITPAKSYQVVPVQSAQKVAVKQARDTLYNTYQAGRNAMVLQKRHLLADIRLEQNTALSEIKQQFAVQRQAIQQNKALTNRAKKLRYEQLRYARIQALAEININAKQGREAVHIKYPLNTWNDFLVKQSDKGSEEALVLLRYKQQKNKKRDGLSAGDCHSDQPQTAPVYQNLSSTVLKNGAVVYDLLKQGKIKDTGQQITVHSGGDKAALVALQMATANYGNYLNVTGSDTFKATIIRLAVEHHPRLRFDDPQLEKTRTTLAGNLTMTTSSITSKEKAKGLER